VDDRIQILNFDIETFNEAAKSPVLVFSLCGKLLNFYDVSN